MTDLATLRSQLDALKRARRSGVLRLRDQDQETLYRSDSELAAEIASLESEIAELTGSNKPRSISLRSSKGWL